MSWRDVAGPWGGFAAAVGVGAAEVAGWVVCGAELPEAGASAGGVSG